ncbi:MAG: hypothetical protein KDE50_03860, partial [Caldilineaceae bacterium]|nr:hypothetical protein [Caldilineaceae bacterium]
LLEQASARIRRLQPVVSITETIYQRSLACGYYYLQLPKQLSTFIKRCLRKKTRSSRLAISALWRTLPSGLAFQRYSTL